MKYIDLLNAHKKYGTTEKDIKNRRGYNDIKENVVIAPCWNHDIFENHNLNCEQVSDIVYNFSNDNIEFSFIEVNRIGAAGINDFILALGVTNCKNVVFVGSAGALDESLKIGDIVIPKYSICGDGAARYLNDNLEDELFKKEYPSENITNELMNVLDEMNINYHNVPNYSVDSLFAQFYHLDKIINEGAKTIEMETALLFKSNELLKRNITAVFIVSDNTVINKSIYSGRNDKDKERRYKMRYEVLPEVLIKLFKNMK